MKIKLYAMALLFLSAASVHAAYWTDANGLRWEYSIIDGEVVLGVSGRVISNATQGTVVIPSRINTYPVTKIKSNAFYACTKVTKFVLPSTEVTIESRAFDSCTSLASIYIPSSVRMIESGAFRNCNQISEVRIDSLEFWFDLAKSFFDISDNPLWHGADLYVSGQLLKEVSIPSDMSIVTPMLFQGCRSLESVTFDEGVVEVGGFAFKGCANLKSVKFSNGVSSILSQAFNGCASLDRVNFPSSLVKLSTSAFGSCVSLEEIDVDADNPVYSVRDGILYNKSGTELILCPMGRRDSVVIPRSVEKIASSAFDGCHAFPSLELNHPIANIDGAFMGCKGISSVKLPEGVVSMEQAFANCTNLRSISIPKSVEKMRGAFYGCSALETVSMPCVADCENAFQDCTSLKSISIPEGKDAIDFDMFYGCVALESVELPTKLKTIGVGAFLNCKSLKSFICPAGVETVGWAAFVGCSGLRELEFPRGAKVQDESVPNKYVDLTYMNLASLERLRMPLIEVTFDNSDGGHAPKTVTYFKGMTSVDYAFGGSLKLGTEGKLRSVNLCEGITTIGEGAFCNSPKLTQVNIPKTVMQICRGAFSGCTGFGNGTIVKDEWLICQNGEPADDFKVPMGVKHIADDVFSGYELKCGTLYIPSSVETIGEGAFSRGTYSNITSLAGVQFIGRGAIGGNLNLKMENGFAVIDGWLMGVSNGLEGAVSLPGSVRHLYCSLGGQRKVTSYDIPPAVDSMPNGGFAYCPLLEEVNLSKNMTRIDDSWFSGCGRLKKVTGMDNVRSIGKEAFLNCTSLTDVDLPDCVTEIGTRAFCGCSALSNLHFPKQLSEMGEECFKRCGFVTLTIPSYIRSIGAYAFSECRSLKSLYFSSKDLRIGVDAFSACTALERLDLTEGVKVEPYGFSDCTALKVICLHSDDIVLGGGAFVGCSALKTFEVPDIKVWCKVLVAPVGALDGYFNGKTIKVNGKVLVNLQTHSGVESIPTGSFAYYDKLSTAIITGVQKIGSIAFEGCSGLKWIVLDDGLESIGSQAFRDCIGLSEVTLPKTLDTLEGGAFVNCVNLRSVTFEGTPPTNSGDPCYNCHPDLVIRVPRNMGWETAVEEGYWKGYPIQYVEIDNSIPYIGENPTTEEVKAAVADSGDSKLIEQVVDAESYNAYRSWSRRLNAQGIAPSAVKSSTQSWMSFALDASKLLERKIANHDLRIERFESAAIQSDGFELSVGIKDVNVGAGATAENLKKVFRLEGASSLDADAFAEDNVDVAIGPSDDGKLKLTAVPKVGGNSFFMRVKTAE